MININFLLLVSAVFLLAVILLNFDKIRAFLFRKIPEEKRYVKICPKCGSVDVKTDFSNPVVWAYGTTTKYKCNSCRYMAAIFPEVVAGEIGEYKKELKMKLSKGEISHGKPQLFDASTGFMAAMLDIWTVFIALGIAMIISGLYLIRSNPAAALSYSVLGIIIVFGSVSNIMKRRMY